MGDDLDLDDILDSALEDFEQEEKGKQAAVPPPILHPPVPAGSSQSFPSAPPSSSFPVFTPPDDNDGGDEQLSQEFVEGMAKLLEELSKGKDGEEGGAGSTDFSRVVEDLEKNLEKSPEFSGVMETLVDHLISKEVLYEPMQEMRGKYPAFLAANKDTLPKEEYDRFSRQFEYIQRICTIYETQPNNTAEVMVVMQDMQAQGQPPQEIVKALAPDMEFGADGMPQMPELDKLADKCSIM